MNLNWKTIITGFIVTLTLYVVGASIGHISILKGTIYVLAPIIGGFTVAYINSSNYVDNIINAGFASGIAGFISLFIISGLIEPVFGDYLELVLVVTITNAIMAFVIGAILGLIGGTIGILIKGQGFEKENTT